MKRRTLPTFILACALGLAAGSLSVNRARADLLVPTFDGSSVVRYNDAGQLTPTGQISSGSGGLTNADGIAVGPDGTLYVSSRGTGQILHYAAGGNFLGVYATLPQDPGPSGPQAAAPGPLHFGPDGNLYVADNGGSTIEKYNAGTQQFTNVVTGLTGAGGFAFTPDGSKFDIYASDFGGGQVVKLNGNTSSQSTFVAPGSSPLETPDGLLFLANGNLLVADLFGNQILKYDPSGNYLGVFATIPPAIPQNAPFPSNSPANMIFDAKGDILLAVLGIDHNGSGAVLEYDTNGNLLGTFASGIAGAADLSLVPEPSSIVLLAIGFGGLVVAARRIRRQRNV